MKKNILVFMHKSLAEYIRNGSTVWSLGLPEGHLGVASQETSCTVRISEYSYRTGTWYTNFIRSSLIWVVGKLRPGGDRQLGVLDEVSGSRHEYGIL